MKMMLSNVLTDRSRRRTSLTLVVAVIVVGSTLGFAPTAGAIGAIGSRFRTLPPGSPLPSDANCAARVRHASEIRAADGPYNATRGTQMHLTGPYPPFARVDGNFTGSTDEIIQWTACKWGIDENMVRAQAVAESWWYQTALGDWTSDAAVCAPNHLIGSDPNHPGQCPESVGLLQVRYQYWSNGFNDVETSTAYNTDYVYAAWRSCYEGLETWLGGTYGPGDAWGCLGVWFAGAWHTSAADGYISNVKSIDRQRVWKQPSFIHG
jgi:hypothetical protein